PAPWSSIPQDPTRPVERSARQTSPETRDYGPGCVAAARCPPLARRECLDAAAPPMIGFSLVPAALLHRACWINLSAAPECSQKIRSAPLALLVSGWQLASQSICPAVPITAPAGPPTLPAASYI